MSVGVLLCTVLVETQDISTEPRRETWQRVADLFAALPVRKGTRVADIGAGDGFLTVRLARAVGASGVVFAVDSDAAVTGRLRERLQREHLTNVQVRRRARRVRSATTNRFVREESWRHGLRNGRAGTTLKEALPSRFCETINSRSGVTPLRSRSGFHSLF